MLKDFATTPPAEGLFAEQMAEIILANTRISTELVNPSGADTNAVKGKATHTAAMMAPVLPGEACPSDLSGRWHGGEGWGDVELWSLGDNGYEGTYTNTWGIQERGLINLFLENRNGIGMGHGVWGEGTTSAGTFFGITTKNGGSSIQGYWSRLVHFRNEFIEQEDFDWRKR